MSQCQWVIFSDFGDSYRIYRACLSGDHLVTGKTTENQNYCREKTATHMCKNTCVTAEFIVVQKNIYIE